MGIIKSAIFQMEYLAFRINSIANKIYSTIITIQLCCIRIGAHQAFHCWCKHRKFAQLDWKRDWTPSIYSEFTRIEIYKLSNNSRTNHFISQLGRRFHAIGESRSVGGVDEINNICNADCNSDIETT